MQSHALLGSALLAFAVTAAGCGGDDATTTSSGSGGTGAGTTDGTGASAGGGVGGTGGAGGAGGSVTTGTGGSQVIGGDRPVKMYIPSSYDDAKPAPLVVLLHGYGATGAVQEGYFGLKTQADQRGFLYAVADGTPDTGSPAKQFWNATDACCNFYGSKVDDSAYLSGVVDQIKAQYNVDAKRVYFVGHSNGGFMSYRMACDHADQIAAIVSLAGATFDKDASCKPSEPVAVAQIHGTNDETVTYEGGSFLVPFPSALKTVETWATHDGCALTTADGGMLDLEKTLPADPEAPLEDTTVSVYDSGCQPGGHVELWTIAGGTHIPNLSTSFAGKVFDFLEAHPKP